ncbi:MAG: hypothetical protein II457_03415 [Paludibacteraceae bacterium]|nr:hypothetical protein [Paludibacteraceae bacterium]
MEEKIVRQLNWVYYGVMVAAIIVLTIMYYVRSRYMEGAPLVDYLSQKGQIIQYIVLFDALITIPLGLYLVKWRKPKTLERYRRVATWRILLVSNTMILGIIAHYAMGTMAYKSMLWVAAIAAVSWYFTKPTLGKLDKEMTPEDSNIETY